MVDFLEHLEFAFRHLVLWPGRHRLLSGSAKLQMSEKDSDRNRLWILCREGDYPADKDPWGHGRVNWG